ncbi:MAG: type II secretion system F family protein [Alphaproteobacteria bacterium]|nr:type II secretion system F family protein [Alphaproteobacteria bacterium]
MNPLDYLPAGLSIGIEDLITLMAGLAASSALLFVWYTLIARDTMADRLKMMAARREALRADYLRPNSARSPLMTTQVGFMRAVVDRANLLRGREAEKAAVRLAQAGIRGRDAVAVYLFCRIFLPFVFGGVGVLAIYWLGLFKVPEPAKMPITMVLVLIGAAAPNIYLKNLATRRKEAMQKGLPDAIDLMVICAEAGLSLDAMLARVSREIGRSCPDLSDELGLTSVELGFLPDRRRALDNLNMRTDMPAVRGLVNTLQQTEKYGTPLAHSLRVLSSEFRDQRMMKAEEKAARLPAIMTVPMIIFIMPALFIVLIGPAVLRTIDAMKGL